MAFKTGLALLLTVLITACAADGNHRYSSNGVCLTCWNNPLTGEPINHDGTHTGYENRPAKLEGQAMTAVDAEGNTEQLTRNKASINEDVGKRQFQIIANLDVDVAYLRLKKAFNYYTDQEIRQEWGKMADAKMQTFAYAYSATPSVYYHMRAHREHASNMAIIDSEIEKLSANQCKVTVTYWPTDSRTYTTGFGESLKKRVQQVLANRYTFNH